MATRPPERKETPVGARTARQITPGDQAAFAAWSPLDEGEAGHIGLAGDTGVGKSTATRALLAAYMKRSPGVVLVIDDKGPRQKFTGEPRRDVADFRRRPVPAGTRVVVFRGDALKGYKVNRDEVAELAWGIIGRGRACLLVNDELKEACTHGQWKPKTVWLPRNFSQGREVGLSDIWGTQDIEEIPAEPFAQSHVIFASKLAGNAVRLLTRRRYLEGVPAGTLESLPGIERPKNERGIFLALWRGRPWDGKFYRFDSSFV